VSHTFVAPGHAALAARADMSAPRISGRLVATQLPFDCDVARRNHLLGALSHEDFARIAPYVEQVRFEQRQLMLEEGDPIRYVYFPETTVASLVSTMRTGGTVEIGTAGCEGMVGLPLFLGDVTSSVRAFAQIPGTALRMEADEFVDLSSAPGPLHDLLLHYTHAFLTQIAQAAACNSAHLVEERCARWLLMTHDRVDGDEFPLTHEFLAFMLGVRRPGVTIAMRGLQDAGIVRYTRGWVEIVDRIKLESVACECYEVVRAHTERLLSRSTRS
jgi:CRP-like cAMP-binding protein